MSPANACPCRCRRTAAASPASATATAAISQAGCAPLTDPGEPGQRAAQRLVLLAADEAGAPRLHEVTAEPPGHGRRGERGAARDDRHRERCRRHRALPEPPGQQQVDDEQQRHELDTRGEASRRALQAPPVRLAQVPGDQCHQHDLDLAEEQRALRRLGPERQAGDEQARAEAPRSPPAKLAERDRDGGGQREQRYPGDQAHQRREREREARREQQRGERRVGELDARVASVVPVVEPAGVAERLVRAAEVHLQVEALEHGGKRVGGYRDEVGDRGRRGHRGTDGEEHAVTSRTALVLTAGPA